MMVDLSTELYLGQYLVAGLDSMLHWCARQQEQAHLRIFSVTTDANYAEIEIFRPHVR